MAVTATTVRLANRLRRDLLKITDQQARDLVAAWARAWDEVAADLDAAILDLVARSERGTISRGAILRSTRLRNALLAISIKLTHLAEDAGVRIVGDLNDVIQQAGAAQVAIIGSQLPRAERDQLILWDQANNLALDAIVRRSTQQITSLTWPLSAEADAVVRREIVRGIAAGSNPRETADRIVKRAQGGFNGGLTRALTIARTETLDAHRAASAVAHRQNSRVLKGWVWLCSLSPKTCPACLGMNGSEHDLDEDGPLGHQNCRCTRAPLTKTWRDLGIDRDEPPSLLPNAGEWFERQPAATQQRILGPSRYAAWKRGDFPMSQWATRKANPDWRPSYVTSGSLSGGRAGSSARLAS